MKPGWKARPAGAVLLGEVSLPPLTIVAFPWRPDVSESANKRWQASRASGDGLCLEDQDSSLFPNGTKVSREHGGVAEDACVGFIPQPLPPRLPVAGVLGKAGLQDPSLGGG